MIASITPHISRGVQNLTTTTKKMSWWFTNFNMPVPTILSPSTTWTRYEGPVSYLTETTSYDLSGFQPGLEICHGAEVYDFYNDGGSSYNMNTNITVRWVDHDNSTTIFYVANSLNISYSIPAGSWYGYWIGGNIGCASWEIHSSNTYYIKAKAVGTPNISEISTSVAFSNCPSVATTGTTGMIYVSGNYLSFINANNFLHGILGLDNGYVGASPGYMWVDTSNNLHYIDESGHDRYCPWKIKQFASFYFNGPTGETYAGTSKAGYIWADNEFGWTHIAYIGYDGYKYLCGAGLNPYA